MFASVFFILAVTIQLEHYHMISHLPNITVTPCV